MRVAGNTEMARVHSDVAERIRSRRGDQAAMLLRAHIQASQAEVRKITLHQVHVARRVGQSPTA